MQRPAKADRSDDTSQHRSSGLPICAQFPSSEMPYIPFLVPASTEIVCDGIIVIALAV